MIEFHPSGDMWGLNANYRVNPVNCKGVMGAGLALLFKHRYPGLFAAYQNDCTRGHLKPGTLTTFTDTYTTIINAPTKRHWQSPSLLPDIEATLLALRAFLLPLGNVTVTMPALGCGHGNLAWYEVKPLLERHLSDLPATIHAFEPGGHWINNWFSNMLPCETPFTYQGITFSTVEAFYQAMKLEKKNVAGRQEIASMPPHHTKKAIRDKARFPWRADWTPQLALEVMDYGLRQKFAVGTKWHDQLLACREPVIEFNNWGDETWGVDLKSGKGANMLGTLLMRIREQFVPNPLATSVSNLITPRQITDIKAFCLTRKTDPDEATRQRFGINVQLCELSRFVASQWLSEIEKHYAKELFA